MKIKLYTGEKDYSILGDRVRVLDFTDYSQSQPFTVLHCDGLDAPEALIETTTNETDGGVVVNNTKADSRIIILDVAINQPIAENRNLLYKYFDINNAGMYLNYIPDSITAGGRNLVIPVRVKKIQVSAFDNPQTAQITMLASRPFFHMIDEELYMPIWAQSNTSVKSYVTVGGDAPCGLILRAMMTRAVSSLTIKIGTEDPTPGKPWLTGNGMYFQTPASGGMSGLLNIDTRDGHKSITLEGVDRFDLLMLDSKWFRIPPGRYEIQVTDSSGIEGATTVVGRCETNYNGG